MKKLKPQKKSAWPQPFRRIKDTDLKNTRRKENYNLAKLSAVMADYGFNLLRLSDDWEGADAIAVHINGKKYLRVQLKGAGLTFEKKYLRKDIWIACPSEGHEWYVYPHDSVLAHVAKKRFFRDTASWRNKGQFKWTRKIPEDVARFLDDKGYKLS